MTFAQAILVTAGPTHEPIDPVRVIANRSSGRQGLRLQLRRPRPGRGSRWWPVRWRLKHRGGERTDVETAETNGRGSNGRLPCDAAILVAAVADWRVEIMPHKLKKSAGQPQLRWHATRDILAELSASPNDRGCCGLCRGN